MRDAGNWRAKEDDAFAQEIQDEILKTDRKRLSMRYELLKMDREDADERLDALDNRAIMKEKDKNKKEAQ